MTQGLQAAVGTLGYASMRFFSSSLFAWHCVQRLVMKGLGGVASTEFHPCYHVESPLPPMDTSPFPQPSSSFSSGVGPVPGGPGSGWGPLFCPGPLLPLPPGPGVPPVSAPPFLVLGQVPVGPGPVGGPGPLGQRPTMGRRGGVLDPAGLLWCAPPHPHRPPGLPDPSLKSLNSSGTTSPSSLGSESWDWSTSPGSGSDCTSME